MNLVVRRDGGWPDCEGEMDDQSARVALGCFGRERFKAEHEIYREDAVLIIRNPASESRADITFRRADLFNRTKSILGSSK
jgi:hypothetical protein